MHRLLWSGGLAIAVVFGGVGLTSCGDLVSRRTRATTAEATTAPSADGRADPDCDAGVPVALACTGLYSDWPTLTVAPDAHPYQPGASMWVDGATSLRWIWLPPGAKVDTTDPNNWVFPVGTKLWQELSILERGSRPASFGSRRRRSGSGRPTPGPTISARRPSSRSASPTLEACPTRSRPSAPARSATTAPTTSCSASRPSASRCPSRPGSTSRRSRSRGSRPSRRPPGRRPGRPDHERLAGVPARELRDVLPQPQHGGEAGQTGLFMKLTVDATGALPSVAQGTDTWLTAYKVPSIFTPGGTTTAAWPARSPQARRPTRRWRVLPARPRQPGTQHHPMARRPARRGDPDAAHRHPSRRSERLVVLDAWVGVLPT